MKNTKHVTGLKTTKYHEATIALGGDLMRST